MTEQELVLDLPLDSPADAWHPRKLCGVDHHALRKLAAPSSYAGAQCQGCHEPFWLETQGFWPIYM